MFGLKFKRKSDPPVVPPGPKTEATTEEVTAFSLHPFIHAPPQHSFSFTGAPVSVSTPSIPSTLYNNTSSSNIDSVHGHNLVRSGSSGSAHLRQKASLTSLNNIYHSSAGFDNSVLNNAGGVVYPFATMPLVTPAQDSAADVIQSYKVPVQTDDIIGIHSQTSTYFSHQSSSTNATMTPSTPSPVAIDADRRSSQGPKINPATKPSAGSFVGAVVTSATPISSDIEFVSISSNSSTSSTSTGTSSATVTVNNAGGAVPTSSASSATPSRSSSTSNRGGAGRSTTGSFTPVSATPPMTPRMGHSETNGHGQDPASLLPSTPTTPQPQPPSQPQIQVHPHHQHQITTPVATSPSPIIFSATTHAPVVTPAAVATMGHHQYQVPIYDGIPPPPTEGEDDGVVPITVTFMTSPISYQPSSNSLLSFSELQGSTPYQFTPNVIDERSNSGPGTSVSTGTGTGDENPSQSRSGYSQGVVPKDPSNNSYETRNELASSASGTAEIAQHDLLLNSGSTIVATTTAGHVNLSTSNQVLGSSSVQDEPSIHATIHATQHQYSNQHGAVVLNGHTTPGINGGVGAFNPGHVLAGGQSGSGSGFFPMPITRASTAMAAPHLITHDVRKKTEQSHIIDGAGPMMLMAIGKTGQGKSSLLNKIMGTSELKASASVRAVTKGIAERTGWGRFEDSRRVLVTLADTPGLADTEGDDEKNIPILKEYIKSIGKRLGVTAFLLVFKIDSGVDMILTILTTFNDIMKEFPDFWDNVVLVFTGCDFRRNVMNTKQLYHDEIQRQLEERFFKERYNQGDGANGDGMRGRRRSMSQDSPTNGSFSPFSPQPDENSSGPPVVPMVFLTCAEAPCGFSLGEKCDCKARTTFLNAGLKRLWYAVKGKRRWVLEEDEDEDGSHS
ncbi:MAG: hypothetical protein J3Q66DRAFT_338703 [Benniella sp.]|nr:MAG: hypothetical protein J3Q66DRAFT_338703 [Benniella sp.]